MITLTIMCQCPNRASSLFYEVEDEEGNNYVKVCQCPNRASSLFYSRPLEHPTVEGFKHLFST